MEEPRNEPEVELLMTSNNVGRRWEEVGPEPRAMLDHVSVARDAGSEEIAQIPRAQTAEPSSPKSEPAESGIWSSGEES